MQRSPTNSDRRRSALPSLERLIEHAAHLLPTQGPISVFVHHNTLHAFEDLPFAEALQQAKQVYGCEPYLAEDRYRAELDRGRIRCDDLAVVLQDDLGDRADELIGLLGTRFHLRLAMLAHPLRTAPNEELRWVIAETDAARRFRRDVAPDARRRVIESTRRWIMRDFRNGREHLAVAPYAPQLAPILAELLESFGQGTIDQWSDATWEAFTLQLLWRICVNGAGASAPTRTESPLRRHRDLLLQAAGEDADELTHDVLIRFCAAFLDQGLAHWGLPNRDRGLFAAFVELFGSRGGVLPHWLRGLRQELVRLRDENTQPLESIEESLELLGVGDDEREPFISATLLALRGWAGMIWQLETNAEWTARPAPRGTLVEYLAVRLIVERFALAHIARECLGYRGPLRQLRSFASRHGSCSVASGDLQRAFVFFQLAQVLGLRPEDLQSLPENTWSRLAAEIETFPEIERRRVFQLAYERRYRNETLDAVAAHARHAPQRQARLHETAPDFQVMCCIDDREESFRRHLEEVHPRCETFGYAGFFGVAMYYRGAADAGFRPLCPVVIKPQHYVEELPVFTCEESHRRRARTRRLLGVALHYVHRASRLMIAGALTSAMGALASAPLVGRILFPRSAARLRGLFGRFVRPPAATQLLLQRCHPAPGPDDGHVGYCLSEMADVVERTLRQCGLTSGFAPIVVVCGHGSSSLNNPHESAYNCGACSGGRGGPNARAFAHMANDPRVRSILADRGLLLPAETYFVGAQHNTCNDAVDYFDLDRLPLVHKSRFSGAVCAIDEARRRNAHERCRRFESAGLAVTPHAALVHVEERSEDLSQARPEYNHAGCAVAVVGRRASTRGLFMDRRSFLASYDPTQDDEQGTILAQVLAAAIPVCAGISLEYYFSCVDPHGYGCGSKLPHNIAALLGVMEGAQSDLRPGLSAQMVEIHEPMRVLFIIETTPNVLQRTISANPVLDRLVRNEWVQVATLDPQTKTVCLYRNSRFEPYQPESGELPAASCSVDWYRGWRDNLGYASVIEEEWVAGCDATGAAQ
ncbi:MAG: DUF2309 domain-containing protein [Planctomycetota bacterium]|nr:MAG: DUF2309 domain-containing protein [Planctomycetota bacterium]